MIFHFFSCFALYFCFCASHAISSDMLRLDKCNSQVGLPRRRVRLDPTIICTTIIFYCKIS